MNVKGKKKRIIYFITKSFWGGGAKYVIDIASGLDRNSFEIFVAAGGKGELKIRAESLGIEYLEIPHFGREVSLLNIINDLLSFFEVLRIFFKLNPDIIHVNSSKAGGVCGLASFLYKISGRNITSIFTAHGWAFHEARPPTQLFLIRLASRISALFYQKIICITKLDYNSALRWKIAPQKKLALIPNGLDISAIKFLAKEEAQKELFGEEKEFVIGTVGEWIRNKGWDILLKAVHPIFEKHPRVTLALVAGGESPDKEKFKIQNSKIKVIENLPEASRYLKAFDLFVFPSRKEGLPYALLEASLAELPIIAAAVGGNFDIVETDRTGVLIPPENHEILTKVLNKFIENSAQFKNLGKNARKKIETEFSLQKMRTETYRLYQY